MFGRTVGIAATCALGASALLLPPGTEIPDSSLSATHLDPKSRSVIIPCSECAFPSTNTKAENTEADDALFWIQGGANSLLLDFTVSEDGQSLLLGGSHIYPPRFPSRQPGEKTIHVTQIPSYGVATDISNGKNRSVHVEVTGYGILESEKEALTSEGDALVPLHVDIIALNDVLVSLEKVQVKLLQTSAGELLIMDVAKGPIPEGQMFKDIFTPSPPPSDNAEDTGDFRHPPPPASSEHHHGPPPWIGHGQEDCSMLPEPLCKLRNMLESKIDAAMGPPHRFRKGGCPGRQGHPHGPPPFAHFNPHMDGPGGEGRPNRHHGRPHHMRPHGPHHRHHHHGQFWRHHFLHAFVKGLVAILIPVMAGITVGMTVSLLGLVFGRLIGFLWIRLVRGGRRGNASIALEEAAIKEDEAKPMLAEMEAPPVYEDAPAYIETEKEQTQE